MSKILIDNDIAMMNGYSCGERFKKFGLSQLKMAWYLVSEVNKYILDLKYENKDFFERIKDVNFEMNDIGSIVIDKVGMKKKCFKYRISDNKLYEVLKDTTIMFELTGKKKFFYIFQALEFQNKEILITPTLNILNMLHCNEKHFEVDLKEILSCKSVNTILFYQWFKSNQYIIKRFHKKLVVPIHFLQEFFLTEMKAKYLIRDMIQPSIQEYTKITDEKIKIRTVKVGNKITSIEFLLN